MSTINNNTQFSDDDIVALARSVEPHDFERIDPPAQIWNNVLAELEVEVASQEATARRVNQRWFSSSRLISAAAATLLMVGVAVAVVTLSGDEPVVEVASAMMTDDGLPVATSAVADAAFVCEAGECFIELDLTALPDAGTDNLELWVINGDVSDMYTLGNVTTAKARYPVPAGVTVQDFPIVDISIEPDDGVATHSGQSVLRGVLEEGV